MSQADQWKTVKVLFDGARELRGAEREAYLQQHCGGDRDLRRELDSLLAAYDSDAEFLETPILAGQAEIVAAALPDYNLGRRIGPYRLTRRLGEGGMGVVYEGARADGEFQQRVAIKLIKRGMDSDHILSRFRNERQILAGLAHPNVGKLLDGGATADGSPYFVMEYIEGDLIDDYCRSRAFPLRARVQLLVEVASAVEHAHGQRVIHRDIKPSNIIVDRNGTPKLLDFGIAKLVDGSDLPERTVTGLRMLTPEYASPEQTRGEAATVRSDVYALGIVLYELLSGRRPTVTGPELPGIENVPRDLLLVVRKATHADPQRRYESVTALIGDLRSYLEGSPVEARPDSVFYRASRAVRKNSRAAWSASLVLVAILASGISWMILKSPGSLAGRRRSVAIVGFQNVSASPGAAWLSTALTEMLNTEVAGQGTVRAIAGDSVARMSADLGLRPSGSYSVEVLQRIRSNLHPDYVITGSYVASGDGPDTLVRIDLRLQDARTADSLVVWTDTGTYAELPAIATRAGAKLRQALGGDRKSAKTRMPASPESARLHAQGLEFLRGYNPLAAKTVLERAVAEDPDNPLVHASLATTLMQLGYQDRAVLESKRSMELSGPLAQDKKLEVEGRYDVMRRDWAGAIHVYQTLWGLYPDNLDYGIALANAQSNGGQAAAAKETLARIRRDPAAAPDARVDLAEALAATSTGDSRGELEAGRRGIEKARKAGSRQLEGECYYDQAWALWQLGDLTASKVSYQAGLKIFSETGNRRRVVDLTSGLATVLLDEGKVDESARLLEETVPIARTLGDRVLEGVVLNNLARCWQEKGELRRALETYEKTAAINRELNDFPNLAVVQLNMAGVWKDLGELNAAERQFSESLEVARRIAKKPTISMALAGLADIRFSLGDLAGASRQQGEALAIAREIDRKTSIASTLRDRGNLLRAQAKLDEAAMQYDEASKVAIAGKAPGRLAEIRIEQAKLLAEQGKTEAAETAARQALDEYRQEHSMSGEAWAEAVLASVLNEVKPAEAGMLARSARGHMGSGEGLEIRLEVERAEALVAAHEGRTGEAKQAWERIRALTVGKGLVRTAWDAEMGIARVEAATGSAAAAKRRARRVAQEAGAKGFLLVSGSAERLIASLH